MPRVQDYLQWTGELKVSDWTGVVWTTLKNVGSTVGIT